MVALPDAVPSRLESLPTGVQSEAVSGEVFAALGLARPRTLVLGPQEAVPEDLGLAYPLVAKLISRDLLHKIEAGAVTIWIGSRATLVHAIEQMKGAADAHTPGARLECVLIQEMRPGLGEAIIGLTHDPLVGPIVTLGSGGILTEIYRDTAVRPAPVGLKAARRMVAEVKGFAALRGYRGKPEGDLDALAQAVSDLSRLALSAMVQEAEINPVAIMARGKGVLMLDALIRTWEDDTN